MPAHSNPSPQQCAAKAFQRLLAEPNRSVQPCGTSVCACLKQRNSNWIFCRSVAKGPFCQHKGTNTGKTMGILYYVTAKSPISCKFQSYLPSQIRSFLPLDTYSDTPLQICSALPATPAPALKPACFSPSYRVRRRPGPRCRPQSICAIFSASASASALCRIMSPTGSVNPEQARHATVYQAGLAWVLRRSGSVICAG